jgi:uncharacterized protein (TIGR02266 family)
VVKIPKTQRRYRRLTIQLEVEYRVGADLWKAQATTLGAGGLFIATRNPFDAGTRLSLRFTLPGGNVEHHLDGRVVWCHAPGDDPPGQTFGMGIAFDRPAGDPALVAELEALAKTLPEAP